MCFRYDAEPALKGVSLRVAPGERVALVGVSGAGKSTIAPCCCASATRRRARCGIAAVLRAVGLDYEVPDDPADRPSVEDVVRWLDATLESPCPAHP